MEATCYLDRDDIPPLGETAHINRNCYCYLCTCGNHSCPSISDYQKPSIKEISSYRQKFTGRQGSPSKPFAYMDEIPLSKQKMELKSTTREDFLPFHVSIKDIQKPHKLKSPFKFNGNSTYKSNFVQYNQLRTQSTSKKYKYEHRSIKFNGKSTYAENFVQYNSPARTGIKKKYVPEKLEYADFDTTYKSTYTPAIDKIPTIPFRHKSVDYTPTESASPQFNTTYANQFYYQSPTKLKPTLLQVQRSIKKP